MITITLVIKKCIMIAPNVFFFFWEYDRKHNYLVITILIVYFSLITNYIHGDYLL